MYDAQDSRHLCVETENAWKLSRLVKSIIREYWYRRMLEHYGAEEHGMPKCQVSPICDLACIGIVMELTNSSLHSNLIYVLKISQFMISDRQRSDFLAMMSSYKKRFKALVFF